MDEKDYIELAVKVQGVESRSRNNEHRLDSLEDDMKGLQDTQISLIKIANSVENMGNSIVSMNDTVEKISTKQDDLNDKVTILENRPANDTKKRLDVIFDKITWLIVGGIVVWLLSQIIPTIQW